MSKDSASPERLSSLPRVEEDVAQSIAQPLNDGGTGQWELLGDEQAALVRQSLLEAERLRKEHTDPGDAFLLGAGFAYRSVSGQIQIDQLRTDLERGGLSSENEVVATTSSHRKGLRQFLGLTTLLAVFNHHKAT